AHARWIGGPGTRHRRPGRTTGPVSIPQPAEFVAMSWTWLQRSGNRRPVRSKWPELLVAQGDQQRLTVLAHPELAVSGRRVPLRLPFREEPGIGDDARTSVAHAIAQRQF